MVTLCILDGLGIREEVKGNAVKLAGMPNLDRLKAKYPYAEIEASGEAVGLPAGQMGNSEVGHLTIGGGRVIEQDLLHIDNEIKNGNFAKNESLVKAFKYAEENGTNIHILGLCSNGGVHSKIEHLFAILDASKKYNIKNIFIHCITDGRDTPVTSGIDFLTSIKNKISGTNAKIADVCGRVYAMDREKRYDRVEKAYRLYVYGEGEKVSSLEDGMKDSYAKNITDEFIEPMVVTENVTIKNGDSVIFFNYRSDRAREITFALTDLNFNEFKVEKFDKLLFTPMQEYAKELAYLNTIYPPKIVEDNLAAIISSAGLKQFHISETTKYAHVTFFLNGGIEKQYNGEERYLVDSYNDKNFAVHPMMRAPEITEKLLEAISSKKYDFLVVNFSNPDMIGHTGDLNAAIEAIKVCDDCAGKVVNKTLEMGGDCIVIADHGNCEEMLLENGEPHTAHTSNKVPFILASEKYKDAKLIENGGLANIAPTVLELMDLKVPSTMVKSMIKNNK